LIPHSTHASAYGRIEVPVYSVKGGSGPTVLLMGGNHGDEYEGQIALFDWLRKVDADQLSGQVFVIPQANVTAAHAGRRTSPIDDGNLNRAFDPGGGYGVTSALAQFIENELISIVDIMIDLHSGGSSLTYIPSALVFEDENSSAAIRNCELSLLKAFGTPIGLCMKGFPNLFSTSVGAAHRHGAVAICTELGGGACVSPTTVEFAKGGIQNVLAQLNILPSNAERKETTRTLSVHCGKDFVHAPEAGLFEPAVDLGTKVESGQPVGSLWFPSSPGRRPTTLISPSSGWVVCKRHPALTNAGDCLLHLASDDLGSDEMFLAY
jgi:predicted deacylase